MGTERLIIENIDLWASAIKVKASHGRGSGKNRELFGLKKLRELILELAVRGKLEPQDANDEPASALLARVEAEKAKQIDEKKSKKTKKLREISIAETPYDLPSTWEWVRLGSIGNIFSGNSISERVKEDKYTNVEGLPFIATKDVGYGFETLDYQNGVAIPEGETEFKIARKGSVLICAEGGSAGKKCGITTQDICFGNKLFANTLYEKIEPKYILSVYLSPVFFSQFSSVMTGIIGGIPSSKFVELLVPLPPLEEQVRITKKVDELMLICDQLEQQTEASFDAHHQLIDTLLQSLARAKSPAEFSENWAHLGEHFDSLITNDYAIEQLKQTILELAVMGKLVQQDPTDEPACKLLAAITTEREKLIKEKKIKKQPPIPGINEEELPFELPPGWCWTQCAHLSKPEATITYGILKPVWVDNGVPTVRIKDMRDGKILLDDIAQCSFDRANKFSKTTLLENDLLIAKDGATLGKTAFVPLELVGGNVTQHVLRFSITDKLNYQFVRLIVDSPIGQAWMKGETKGVALPGVNVGDFRRMPMAIPPLNEQQRIVNKVDQLMLLCDQLKAHFSEAQATQSLMSDAVAYELVGEPVQNREQAGTNRETMKIMTTLSINQEQFDESAVIATIIRDLGGAADAKDVWNKTQMTLPEFYAQLKIEIDANYIFKPASAIF